MNRKTAIVVIVLLSATVIGVVSTRGALPSSPSPILTAHVTSTDIEILNVVPTLTFQSNSLGVASTGIAVSRGLSGGPQNLTSAFSFSPVKGFTTVNSALLTIVYFASSAGMNGFRVQVNAHASVIVPAGSFQNAIVGDLNNQDLRVGANTLNLGINLDSSSNSGGTFVYQVRMTIEYTFLSAD